MISQGRSSRSGAPLGQQECCGISALPSFALPRLRICYTARNHSRSAKPASSLLTELFPRTPLRRQKYLFPGQENKTFISIETVTTHKFRSRQAGD
jgi:hypothetical protein